MQPPTPVVVAGDPVTLGDWLAGLGYARLPDYPGMPSSAWYARGRTRVVTRADGRVGVYSGLHGWSAVLGSPPPRSVIAVLLSLASQNGAAR
jgi:hypothetical protein